MTALLNMFGALPIFFIKKMPQKAIDIGLGFAAGVMLGASFTSLIIPSIQNYGLLQTLLGIVLGALVIALSDQLLPHMHFIIGKEGLASKRLKAIWLFIVAITIHNMPEGLAVGVGFGSGNVKEASTLMLAIGFQNMPEGLSVAFSLISAGSYGRLLAFLIASVSGFIEPPLSLLGAFSVSIAETILPYAMGFAAGAMLFVISDEIIPETHRLGHQRLASYGLMVGIVVMLTLDVMLS